jgi:hypothetical protein
MNTTTVLLLALGLLALLAIAFFAVFRGKGKLSVKSRLGELRAEGENPPPPGAVAAGVKVSGEAGRDIRARSTSEGGVDVSAKAKGGIEATHEPGQPPPKA